MQIDFSKVPQEILLFLNELNSTGDFWLVGGCIRDLLLGRTPKDWDIVTTTPEVCEGRYNPIGKTFPVWQTQVGSHTIEIASARTERKVGIGHTGFEVKVTRSLEEDLLRRDLTVNAMAWRQGEDVVDPYGAEQDIESKLLRHVSPAFAEDPLRVFRVARFLTQFGEGWSIHPSTLDLMLGLSEETRSLPADRVREELTKVLKSGHPSKFFSALKQAGCLSPWFSDPSWKSLQMREFLDCSAMLSPEEILAGFGAILQNPSSFCDKLGYGKSVWQSMSLVKARYNECVNATSISVEQLLDLWKHTRRGTLGITGFVLVCKVLWVSQEGQWVFPGYLLEYVDAILSKVHFNEGITPEEIKQTQLSTLRMFLVQNSQKI